jgi:hypothetical protein
MQGARLDGLLQREADVVEAAVVDVEGHVLVVVRREHLRAALR